MLVFLLVILGLALGLGYHAIATARSHSETVDGALRNYSSMAAWEFSRTARENLDRLLWRAFDDVPRGTRSRELPSPAVIAPQLQHTVRNLRCRCSELRDPLAYFRVNLADGSVVTLPDPIGASRLKPVTDALVSHQRSSGDVRFGVISVPPGDYSESPVLTAYSVVYDRSGTARAIFGFITTVSAYEELFGRWFNERPLLPPAIAGEGTNDSLLFMAVRTHDETPAFESSVAYPTTYVVRDSIGSDYAGLFVEASVRPDVANHLIIGGLPRSRLPLIFALLLLTLGVGAAALYQLRREHQLARLREDFVSGVSHELRTPLAQIRMFAELLDGGRLQSESERVRSMGVINREARRLTHLVENILRFSRSGRMSAGLRIERLDVDKTVREVIEAFGPLAVSQEVSIDARVEDGLTVRADRGAVSQMLLNLLDNAVKYGPRGQTITVNATRKGQQLQISVQDQGPGIPVHERQRIWQPYKRLTHNTKQNVAGTGIGLAVVDELVALHDGKVWVEDAAGGGARFTLELPGAETSVTEAPARPEATA
ncbi:MAG: HAMP domain-containing histidine kinase [Gemmatimonadota bacterium]|nr:MAG: HAMP domain-containing histidine kinase [Gemmatimonadota bacterium]